ncbi:tumor necrosis factor receptor superfamily member 26-like isoform X1 [Lethenteron reissneri]|uniref:tumor necrosis factor receptor superfamily member 26-like isoform X1 n=1 Tax=Lethenteron reissneri TaxID=7753 RepID=UPI002AB7323A|nr:tumor necrosis factor receptor superfamily member 26-like isoform X1 [Lethenteron reissneri]
MGIASFPLPRISFHWIVLLAVVNARACNETTHYLFDNICCEKCPPGTFLSLPCGASSKTQCAPCRSGTFQNELNKRQNCEPCTRCNTALSHQELDKCTAVRDRVCGCAPAVHVRHCLTDDCSKFLCCKGCPQGHKIERACNLMNATKCTPLPTDVDTDGHRSSTYSSRLEVTLGNNTPNEWLGCPSAWLFAALAILTLLLLRLSCCLACTLRGGKRHARTAKGSCSSTTAFSLHADPSCSL